MPNVGDCPSWLSPLIVGFQGCDTRTDKILLTSFAGGDSEAFSIIVARYATLVWSVCRRLPDLNDAEDAFQATFLILARRPPLSAGFDSLAGWLFTVSRRVVSHTRRSQLRRERHERHAAGRTPETTTPPGSGLGDILDSELARLPDRFRDAIVLCYLQGKTHAEAARLLDCPVGSLSALIARGCEMLRDRLGRRGFVLGGGQVAVLIATTADQRATAGSISLVRKTVKAAGPFASDGIATSSAARLALSASRGMGWTKFTMLLLASIAIVGASIACLGAANSPDIGFFTEPRSTTSHQAPVDSANLNSARVGIFESIPEPGWMVESLESVRAKYNLPALSASIVIQDQVVAAAAVGRRKVDDPTLVARNDRFKVGALSAAITTTLVGVLVDAGVIQFEDTLAQMYPELVEKMQPEYRGVTVAQLLAHTSGMPPSPSKTEPSELFSDLDAAMRNRYQYVTNALADRPLAEPGKRYIYGGGHVIVAHYAERKTGKLVDDLFEEYVYRKLGWERGSHVSVTTAPNRLDGAWPHTWDKLQTVPREPRGESGKSRLPAGGVCCSMTELGKLTAAHLQGARGGTNLISASTYSQMHALQLPEGAGATMAFLKNSVAWANGPCFWQNGSDGEWFCVVHLLPDENYATCVATNCGGSQASDACQLVHREMIKRISLSKRTTSRNSFSAR